MNKKVLADLKANTFISLIFSFVVATIFLLVYIYSRDPNEWINQVLIQISANILTFALIIACVILISQVIKFRPRSKIYRFFKIETSKALTIFVSRHEVSTQVVSFKSDSQNNATEKPEKTYRQSNSTHRVESPAQVITASPIEIFVAGRLKREILRPLIAPNWLPLDIRESVDRIQDMKIDVNLKICPNRKIDYERLVSGTYIFIGSARANHGSLYFLYEKNAAIIRFRYEEDDYDGKPGEIEFIGHPERNIKYEDGRKRNVAIVQRYTTDDHKTIFYLAGNTAVGTALAVQYLQEHWKELDKKYGDQNFEVVLEGLWNTNTETELGFYFDNSPLKEGIHYQLYPRS